MRQLTELEKACVKEAFKKLLGSGYFDITAIDKIGKMLGVNPQQHRNYAFLHGLHCVDYIAMDPLVRAGLEKMILETFRPESVFSADRLFNAVMAEGTDWIDAEDIVSIGKPAEKPKGILKFLKP